MAYFFKKRIFDGLDVDVKYKGLNKIYLRSTMILYNAWMKIKFHIQTRGDWKSPREFSVLILQYGCLIIMLLNSR